MSSSLRTAPIFRRASLEVNADRDASESWLALRQRLALSAAKSAACAPADIRHQWYARRSVPLEENRAASPMSSVSGSVAGSPGGIFDLGASLNTTTAIGTTPASVVGTTTTTADRSAPILAKGSSSSSALPLPRGDSNVSDSQELLGRQLSLSSSKTTSKRARKRKAVEGALQGLQQLPMITLYRQFESMDTEEVRSLLRRGRQAVQSLQTAGSPQMVSPARPDTPVGGAAGASSSQLRGVDDNHDHVGGAHHGGGGLSGSGLGLASAERASSSSTLERGSSFLMQRETLAPIIRLARSALPNTSPSHEPPSSQPSHARVRASRRLPRHATDTDGVPTGADPTASGFPATTSAPPSGPISVSQPLLSGYDANTDPQKKSPDASEDCGQIFRHLVPISEAFDMSVSLTTAFEDAEYLSVGPFLYRLIFNAPMITKIDLGVSGHGSGTLAHQHPRLCPIVPSVRVDSNGGGVKGFRYFWVSVRGFPVDGRVRKARAKVEF